MFTDRAIENLRRSIKEGAPVTGPADLQILPTPRCNAACVFCPLNAIPGPLMQHAPRFSMYDRDLSGGLLDRLADDLHHLGGLERVTVTGGEPLLYTHIIPAVFQFSRSFPQARMTIVTNGIRLKRFAQFFVMAGLDELIVSINAGAAESWAAQNPGAAGDSFERIVEGVAGQAAARKAQAAGNPRINLSVVLTRHSAADVEALFELARKAGADAVTFLPLMEIRLAGQAVNRDLRVGADEFKRFMEEVAEFGARAEGEGFFLGYAGSADDGGVISDRGTYSNQPCYAGYAFAAVYPNGDVRPCCHCEPVMGNMRESSFYDIWRSERFRQQRERMLKIAQRGQELDGCLCKECGYLHENIEIHRRIAG